MKKTNLALLSLAVLVTFLPSLVSAAVSIPKPLSPGNGAKNYHSAITRLSWTKIPGATSYDLVIKEGNIDFSGVEVKSFSANFVLASELDVVNNGHTYYWRVRAKVGSEISAWSPIYKFSTIAQPGAATLLSPNNLTLSKSALKDFSWKVDKNTVFSTINFYYTANEDGSCSDTKIFSLSAPAKGTKISFNNFLTAINPGKYCWSVVTYGNSTIGNAGVESVKAKFTLTDLKLVPNSLFAMPGFGSTIFYWEKFSLTPATLQVSKNISFPAGENTVTVESIADNYLLSGATSTPDQFKNFINNNLNVDLYWRVGVGGNWSKVQKFRTIGLTKPVAIYPANNTTNFIATSSVFRWGRVNNASFYKLFIGDSNGNSLKTYYSNAPSYKMPVNPAQGALNASTDYDWAVIAYSDSAESVPSDAFSFRTK